MRRALAGAAGEGAVAAGHEATARVGAQVLSDGGNAADAAVAMVCAATVCESTLTSLGGGGFFLVGGGSVEQPVMIDAFVRTPGLGHRPRLAPWESYDLELDGTVLSYGTGPASVAVPGIPAGLARVAARFGRLGFAACALPAAELAQSGVELTEFQSNEQGLNLVLLSRDPDGRQIFVDPATGRSFAPGAVLRQPMLAASLEEIAATGGRSFYEGGIAKRLMEWSDRRGARIAPEDISGYHLHEVDPLEVRIGDGVLLANPAPAYGGRLLGRLLPALLAGIEPGVASHAGRGRDRQVADAIVDLLHGIQPPRTVPPVPGERVATGVDDREWARSPNTTHVVAVDSDGMYVSATTTVGYGSGEFIPGTGIQLNNMLAEYDHTLVRAPGTTVPSMMTPSAWVDPHRVAVVGSAGSDRIPQALGQVIARLVDGRATSIADAVGGPRFVFDGQLLHVEPGLESEGFDRIEGVDEVNRWRDQDAYFGTTNAALLHGGMIEAIGDPRRTASAIVL